MLKGYVKYEVLTDVNSLIIWTLVIIITEKTYGKWCAHLENLKQPRESLQYVVFSLDSDLIVGCATYSSKSSEAGRSGSTGFDAPAVSSSSHGSVTMS